MPSHIRRVAGALAAATMLCTPALAQITQVSDAAGLDAAVKQGATYIEITEHIDLTTSGGILPLMPQATTLGILGNCASPPPDVTGGVPLGDVAPGTCVIVTPTILFHWATANFGARTVWMDQLHIRLVRDGMTPEIGSLVEWNPESPNLSTLWVTNTTFQGDGNPGANGLATFDADALVEGSTFSFNNGFALSVVAAQTNMRFITMLNNTAPEFFGIVYLDMGGRARLEAVSRINNTNTGDDILIDDEESEAFDGVPEVLQMNNFTAERVRGLSSSGSRFLTPGDPAIQSLFSGVMNARAAAPVVTEPAAEAPVAAGAGAAPATADDMAGVTAGSDAAAADSEATQGAVAPAGADNAAAGVILPIAAAVAAFAAMVAV